MFAIARRRMLQGSLSGWLGCMLRNRARAGSTASTAGAKRCILLWMNGGPSQLETFDPKPATSTGGPTRSLKTNVPGIQIADHFPQLATRTDRLCISHVTSKVGEHERAQYYMHTGFRLEPAFPRPAFGSVVSHETPESDIPKYVLLGGRGFGPAYCGPDHASFAIEDIEATRELLGQIRRRRDSLEFLRTMGSDFDQRNAYPAIARRSSMISRIQRLVETPFRDALQLADESQQTRDRYGDHEFGRRCLLARRLLENDVPFVELQLDGWDTHVNNFESVSRLAAMVDTGWSALVDDLISNGLWDETLIVWMGDFGRTPNINGQNGRDHFPTVSPVVLAGGCVKTGQVLGKTNRLGTAIEGETRQVADVAATILQSLGIAPDQEFTTDFGSPTSATDDGEPIHQALA